MAATPSVSPAPSASAAPSASSVLGTLPGAVTDPDSAAGIAWHYGDPLREQRAAGTGAALLDLTDRPVYALTGPDARSWLHSLTTQATDDLEPGEARQALLLSPTGHIEHHLWVTAVAGDAETGTGSEAETGTGSEAETGTGSEAETGTGSDAESGAGAASDAGRAQRPTLYLDTEPGRGAPLAEFLSAMKFWSKVDLAPAPVALLRLVGPKAGDLAAAVDDPVFVRPGGADAVDVAVRRQALPAAVQALIDAGATPAGTMAADALRAERREPRFGVDTDERTIPNEMPWLTTAVHLHKGCYRGQETVARVHNLGRPPRRWVLLNLDGSVDRLPAVGSAVVIGAGAPGAGKTVGVVGTVAQHHQDGPVALALVKRSVPQDVPLLADGVDAMMDPADFAAESPASPQAAGASGGGAPRSAIDHRAFAAVRRPRR